MRARIFSAPGDGDIRFAEGSSLSTSDTSESTDRVAFWTFSTSAAASANCPFPSVPYAASYANVSGGPDSAEWKIRYKCDAGFELFGEDERKCEDGEWEGDDDDLPHCATNVAVSKPAKASSEVGAGLASKAVDLP